MRTSFLPISQISSIQFLNVIIIMMMVIINKMMQKIDKIPDIKFS